jgi:hypothetical protein
MNTQSTWLRRHRLTGVAVAAGIAVAGFAGGLAVAAQPHMDNALSALQTAKNELQISDANKGGHRVNAMRLIDQAMGEVRAGIAAAR